MHPLGVLAFAASANLLVGLIHAFQGFRWQELLERASGTLVTAQVGPEFFAILPLMSFGEAVANGTIVAMAVIYKPRWVMSFDDRLYLAR